MTAPLANKPGRAPSRELMPIGEIVARLSERLEALLDRLGLHGNYDAGRNNLIVGQNDPANRWGGELWIRLRDGGKWKRGFWKVWASGECGDALDLVAELQCAGNKSEAIRWTLDFLGIRDQGSGIRDQKEDAAWAAERERRRAEEEARAAADEIARRQSAKAIWLYGPASLKGTPAETYLRRRGIDFAAPAFNGRQPSALRFHPGLSCPDGRVFPALVAAMARGPDFVAVHRIWLTPEGGKAPIVNDKGENNAKQAYGSYRGGCISLWRGAGNKALKDALAGSIVWVCEGIEDGLSIVALTGGADRVVAAVSLNNIAALVLPPAISTVVIAAQNDPFWHKRRDQAHPTRQGLDRAIRHFQAEGREVRVWRVPEWHAGQRVTGCKDANDFLDWLHERGRQDEFPMQGSAA